MFTVNTFCLFLIVSTDPTALRENAHFRHFVCDAVMSQQRSFIRLVMSYYGRAFFPTKRPRAAIITPFTRQVGASVHQTAYNHARRQLWYRQSVRRFLYDINCPVLAESSLRWLAHFMCFVHAPEGEELISSLCVRHMAQQR